MAQIKWNKETGECELKVLLANGQWHTEYLQDEEMQEMLLELEEAQADIHMLWVEE